MKTAVLACTLLTAVVSAVVPASAQFASTGDGIFGRDYRSERQAKAVKDRDFTAGYVSEEAVDAGTTGSVRAVTTSAAPTLAAAEAARGGAADTRDQRR